MYCCHYITGMTQLLCTDVDNVAQGLRNTTQVSATRAAAPAAPGMPRLLRRLRPQQLRAWRGSVVLQQEARDLALVPLRLGRLGAAQQRRAAQRAQLWRRPLQLGVERVPVPALLLLFGQPGIDLQGALKHISCPCMVTSTH